LEESSHAKNRSIYSAVSIELRLVTDRQTDRQTDTDTVRHRHMAIASTHANEVGFRVQVFSLQTVLGLIALIFILYYSVLLSRLSLSKVAEVAYCVVRYSV